MFFSVIIDSYIITIYQFKFNFISHLHIYNIYFQTFIKTVINIKIQMQDLIADYLLDNQSFLKDYIINKTTLFQNKIIHYGIIQNTDQKIKITKIRFDLTLLPRFRILVNLFDQGIILADSIFIFKQNDHYWYYIIEADFESDTQQQKFQTLNSYLMHKEGNQIKIATKLKCLIEKVHQQGQNYLCITPNNVILQDETNLYLSPFQLNQTHFLQIIKQTDNRYKKSYMAPQIFEKIINPIRGKDKIQITKKELMRADYWSFGCILLQLFVLASPSFYSVTYQQQYKKFQEFFNINADQQQITLIKIVQQISDKNMKYLIMNSLQINPQKRNLKQNRQQIKVSQSTPSHPSTLVLTTLNQQQNTSKKLIQLQRIQWQQQKQQKNHNLSTIKQASKSLKNDNLLGGQCTFSFSILSISNYVVKQQLKITLDLFSSYCFYVHRNIYNNQNQNKYLKLEKSVTVKSTFQEFQKLFQKNISIYFQDQNFKGKTSINLGILSLKSQHKRLWQKPIIGSYTVSNTKNSKIKISCYLECSEQQNEVYEQQQWKQMIKTQKKQENVKQNRQKNEKSMIKQQQIQLVSNNNKKVQTKNQQNGIVNGKSSILQISEQLQNLKNMWKNKQWSNNKSLQVNKNEDISKKIADLLDL